MDQIQFYEAKLNFETDAWDLFEDLNKNNDIIVVDARSNQAFEIEHIPTAISFPHITMSELTTINLDKTKTYVTYCDGIGCNASTKGALKLSKLRAHAKIISHLCISSSGHLHAIHGGKNPQNSSLFLRFLPPWITRIRPKSERLKCEIIFA